MKEHKIDWISFAYGVGAFGLFITVVLQIKSLI